MHTLRIGDVRDIGVDIGPLISARRTSSCSIIWPGWKAGCCNCTTVAGTAAGAYFRARRCGTIAGTGQNTRHSARCYIVRWRQGELPQLVGRSTAAASG